MDEAEEVEVAITLAITTDIRNRMGMEIKAGEVVVVAEELEEAEGLSVVAVEQALIM